MNSLEQALNKAEIRDKKQYGRKKAKLANTIFLWANEFSQTDVYRRLQKRSSNPDYAVQIFEKSIRGLQGICADNDEYVFRLYLKKDGGLFYRVSLVAKNGPGFNMSFHIRTIYDLESKYSYECLKEFAKTIDSEEVYDYLKKRLR